MSNSALLWLVERRWSDAAASGGAPADDEDNEWLYKLNQLESGSRFADLNHAFEAAATGDVPSGRRSLAAARKVSPALDERLLTACAVALDSVADTTPTGNNLITPRAEEEDVANAPTLPSASM